MLKRVLGEGVQYTLQHPSGRRCTQREVCITCAKGAIGDGVPASRGWPPALALMAHAPPVQGQPGQAAFRQALSSCHSCLHSKH